MALPKERSSMTSKRWMAPRLLAAMDAAHEEPTMPAPMIRILGLSMSFSSGDYTFFDHATSTTQGIGNNVARFSVGSASLVRFFL
jgi:hypothetical protein